MTDCIGELDVASLEAEALMLPEIKPKVDELRHCIRILRVAIDALIDDKYSGGRTFEGDREFSREIRSKLNASRTQTDNELTNKIALAVSSIEEVLKPILGRS